MHLPCAYICLIPNSKTSSLYSTLWLHVHRIVVYEDESIHRSVQIYFLLAKH